MKKTELDEKCKEFSDNRPRIIVEENRKKYIGLNKSGKLISKYRVDNCLIIGGRNQAQKGF